MSSDHRGDVFIEHGIMDDSAEVWTLLIEHREEQNELIAVNLTVPCMYNRGTVTTNIRNLATVWQ